MNTTRRKFLKGLGGVALALPFLELTSTRAKAQGDSPRRFLQFLHPQGTVYNNWRPSGAGRNFTLTPVLSPLEPHKSELVVVSGTWTKVAELNEMALADGHMRNTRSVLTAMPLYDNVVNGQHVPNVDAGNAAGPSIDQELASRIGDETPFRTLNLGVGGPIEGNVILHAGPNDPVSLDHHPQFAFDKLFTGNDPMAQDTLSRLRVHRKSVLDAVSDSFTQLDGRVGSADRQRLEAHADKIREIEKQLDNMGTPGNGCMDPDLVFPGGYNPEDHNFDDESSRLMTEIMVMAMACDLTRVGTIQHTDTEGPWFPWLDVDAYGGYVNWHERVHLGDPDHPDFLTIMRWYMEEFAYLLQRMAETPDGDGSLLDHSLVMSISEMGNGATHDYWWELPFVFAGGLCGAMETGRHVVADGRSNADVLTTVLQKFGQPDQCFGWPSYCSGPIAGL